MRSDAQRWNERYVAGGSPMEGEPASFLAECVDLLPPGRALDVAAGAGRNAVFLAAQGWHVTAVDISGTALEKARLELNAKPGANERATLPRVARHAGPGIALCEADLDSLHLPPEEFELIVCFRFLNRALFPFLESALRSGGMLVYETYTRDQLAYGQGPQDPAHLLEHGELAHAFPGLRALFYREYNAGRGVAALLAQKCGPRTRAAG
jgi:tellurite methyltransferase